MISKSCKLLLVNQVQRKSDEDLLELQVRFMQPLNLKVYVQKCIDPNWVLPPANEVRGKVVSLHMSVSYSVHGGGGICPIVCWNTHPPGRHPPGQTPTQRQTPLSGQTPPRTLCYAVNKRAVRILLECILVVSHLTINC